jgi:uncharacterized protein (TIGR00369 family)
MRARWFAGTEVEMDLKAPPEGFSQRVRTSPVTAAWGPLFSRRGDAGIHLGVWVREAHCNRRGVLHGGVIAALADSAMSQSCMTSRENVKSAATVSLSVDYVASVQVGQWLLIEARVLKAGTTLAFADAMISADGAIVARASGTFRMRP